MHIIAKYDKLGVSKFDLYLFKTLHLLSFKKFKWAERQIMQITEDIETIKDRKMY